MHQIRLQGAKQTAEAVEEAKFRRGIFAAVLLREVMIPESFLPDEIPIARFQGRHVDSSPASRAARAHGRRCDTKYLGCPSTTRIRF